MVLSFDEFINEKMGVALRVNQDDDVFGLSKIVNSFMDNISKNPNEDYSRGELILNQPVQVCYEPKGLKYHGVMGVAQQGEKIVIYKRYSDEDYLEIKYFLIHELVHIIQQITSSVDIKKLSIADRIKYLMVKPTIDELTNGDPNWLFMYLLYREELGEIFAWSNNAYEKAFQYKKDNPECSNQEVVKHVLKELYMTKSSFDIAMQDVYKDKNIFGAIISILVGNFSELSDIKTQSYFDKSIFRLPIILKMRRQLSNILHVHTNMEDIINNILLMINENMVELEKIRDEIIDSFVEHVKYWFEKIQNKLGKAIQLGIDDATEN